MKLFSYFPSLPKKNQVPHRSGISLLIALGTSMFILLFAFMTLNSVSRSLVQAGNIQRSTQSFFASESGLEAGFFHHNTRGAGLDFSDEEDSNLEITHEKTQSKVRWEIQGRSDEELNNHHTWGGLLKSGQSVEIPFFWDKSTTPTNDPEKIDFQMSINPNEVNFNLIFFNALDSDTKLPSNFKKKLRQTVGDFNIKNPKNDFNFGDDGDGNDLDGDKGATGPQVLLDWQLSRKSDAGIETFIPEKNDTCINSTHNNLDGFICENQLLSGEITLNSTSTNITGKIRPRSTTNAHLTPTLSKFWNCKNASNCRDYRLSFRLLLPLSHTQDTSIQTDDLKVPGIPFAISLQGFDGAFPKNYYTVSTQTVSGDFSQGLSVEVLERAAIGAFDYVIFD